MRNKPAAEPSAVTPPPPVLAEQQEAEYLDIPAFLRRQAD